MSPAFISAIETAAAEKEASDALAAASVKKRAAEQTAADIAESSRLLAEALGAALYAELRPALTRTDGRWIHFSTDEVFGWRLGFAVCAGVAGSVHSPIGQHPIPDGADNFRVSMRNHLVELCANNRQAQREEKRRVDQAAAEQARIEEAKKKRAEDEAAVKAKLDSAMAQAALFQWPAGAVLTLDCWEWQIGASPGAPGADAVIEFDHGWTANLDATSKLGFMALYSKGRARTVRLFDFHLPRPERFRFHSTDELPAELTEHVNIEVKGIERAFGDAYHLSESGTAHVFAGRQPLKWIRELLS